MGVLDELQVGRVRLAWDLFIRGIPYRFASTSGIDRGAQDGTTAVLGILPNTISTARQRLPEEGGIGEAGNVTLSLGDNGTATSARQLLTRRTRAGARQLNTLVTTVPMGTATPPTITVTVDSDPAGWPLTGALYYFYMGMEAFVATGLGVAPNRFLVVSREQYGSRRQHHEVSTPRGWRPTITSDPVAWIGRPAELWVTCLTDTGQSTGWVQFANGYLEGTPAVDADGSIGLVIVPHLAVMRDEVGGATLETHLTRHYHFFTDGEMNALEFGERWEGASAWFEMSVPNAFGPAGTINFADNLSHVNDLAMMVDTTYNRLDARRMPLKVSNVAEHFVYGALADRAVAGSNDQMTGCVVISPLANLGNLSNGVLPNPQLVQNIETTYYRSHKTPSGLVQWPGEWIRNGTTGFNDKNEPRTILSGGDGANSEQGMWANARFMEVDGQWYWQTWYTDEFSFNQPLICFWSYRLPAYLWFPIMFESAPWSSDARKAIHRRMWNYAALAAGYPIDWAMTNPKEGLLSGSPSFGLPCYFATAFYQGGETSLLVEDDIYRSEPHWVKASWSDAEYPDAPTMQIMKITGTTLRTYGTTAVGYSLQLSGGDREQCARYRSFADWTNERDVTIRPVAWWGSLTDGILERTSIALLEFLLSVRGGQDQPAPGDIYDVQPYGLELHPDDVNIADIAGWDAPVPLRTLWSLMLDDGANLEDVFGPILRTSNVALVQRLDPTSGRRKIALVPTGLANQMESVRSITNVDIAIDEDIISGTDDNIINRWEWQLNLNSMLSEADDPALTVIVQDVDSINWHGRVESREEKLYGVMVVGDAEVHRRLFVPIFMQKKLLWGEPRITAELTLSFADGFRLDAGSVVSFTSSHIVDFDGGSGVTAVMSRVYEIEHDPQEGTTRVKLILNNRRMSGYAPAMIVSDAAWGGANQLQVSQNEYTSATHWLTGAALRDSDYFDTSADGAGGGLVYGFAPGGWVTKASLTITAISNNDITFSAAHGLANGNIIIPQTYPAVSAELDDYIYIASNAGTVDGDTGYQYN